MCKELTWNEKYALCSKSYLSIEDISGLIGCGRPKAKKILESIKKNYSKQSASNYSIYKYKVPTADALMVLGISENEIFTKALKEKQLASSAS